MNNAFEAAPDRIAKLARGALFSQTAPGGDRGGWRGQAVVGICRCQGFTHRQVTGGDVTDAEYVDVEDEEKK